MLMKDDKHFQKYEYNRKTFKLLIQIKYIVHVFETYHNGFVDCIQIASYSNTRRKLFVRSLVNLNKVMFFRNGKIKSLISNIHV